MIWIQYRNDNVKSSSNCCRNDVESTSISRRILVEILVVSTRIRREIDEVSTSFRRCHFDVVSASIRRGFRRGFGEKSMRLMSFRRYHFDVKSALKRRGFRRGFGKKSIRFRRRFDVIISTSNPRRNDEDFDEDSARNR